MKAFKQPVVLVACLLTAACSRSPRTAELPLSLGPCTPLPAGPVRTIEQRGDTLILPPASTQGERQLGVVARRTFVWRELAQAIQRSVGGAEQIIRIIARNSQNNRCAVSLPAYSRFTGVILADDTDEVVPDEHVFGLRMSSAGNTEFVRFGSPAAASSVAGLLDSLFVASGARYFPPMEKPNRAEFPVWIQPEGDVTLQDVVNAVGIVQTAGFPTTLVALR